MTLGGYLFSTEFECELRDRVDYYLSTNPYGKFIIAFSIVAFVIVLLPLPNQFELSIFIGPIVGAVVSFLVGHILFILHVCLSLYFCSSSQRKIILTLNKDEIRIADETGTSTSFPRSQIKSYRIFNRGKLIKFGSMRSAWFPARAFENDQFDQEILSQLKQNT